MTKDYESCEYFNLNYTALPDNICSAVSAIQNEHLVLGVFLLFLLFLMYYKIKGGIRTFPSFSLPKMVIINTSLSFQRFIIIMFFANLLAFIVFY
jgi:hypothetical protein